MPYPAATSTATHAITAALAGLSVAQLAAAAFIAVVAVGLYLLGCLIFPFGKCRRCRGIGLFKSPLSRSYRHCPRCKSSGLRIRAGRHVINHIRATHGAGTKGDHR